MVEDGKPQMEEDEGLRGVRGESWDSYFSSNENGSRYHWLLRVILQT